MTIRFCPKCGSTRVQVIAKVAENFDQKLQSKTLIYDFKTGFSFEDYPIINIERIIKCLACGESYDEEKWKIIFEKGSKNKKPQRSGK